MVPSRPARPTSTTTSVFKYKFNTLPPSGVSNTDKKSKYPASATTMSGWREEEREKEKRYPVSYVHCYSNHKNTLTQHHGKSHRPRNDTAHSFSSGAPQFFVHRQHIEVTHVRAGKNGNRQQYIQPPVALQYRQPLDAIQAIVQMFRNAGIDGHQDLIFVFVVDVVIGRFPRQRSC